MKKSILALGAAAAVAGFAGVAHADIYIGPASNSTADAVRLAPNGVGQYLFAPYFTTQGDNTTLLSVVNTDSVNGKAVKVRFRGAANSDDVLDFTVFLSPSDVWTASLAQGADGLSEIVTPDTSCTLPQFDGPTAFKTDRLDWKNLNDAQLAEHTREGYVEILNMADIPPMYSADATKSGANPVFTNIKHKNGAGTAPCIEANFGSLVVAADTPFDPAAAANAGLAAPTGGLMGGWQIVKLSNISTYSGVHTAVEAIDSAAGVAAPGQIVFSPQSDETVGRPANINESADPLLQNIGSGVSFIPLTYQDLPDMSTPLIVANDAGQQALSLSQSLAKTSIKNEFVSTNAGAAVPGNTDWVVSQPTRRYNVALAYDIAGLLPGVPLPIINGVIPSSWTLYNPNAMTVVDTAFGRMICTGGSFGAFDREEVRPSSVSWSPSRPARYCGEVITLSFNDNGDLPSRVLSANLTKATANTKAPTGYGVPYFDAGWATLSLSGAVNPALGLPVTGFAATSLLNQSQNGNYGYTLSHRW